MPTPGEYRTALQHPQQYFADSELQKAIVKKDKLGLPLVMTGNFAVVFNLQTPSGPRAVRCFHRNAPDLQSRYKAISAYLQSQRGSSESLVDFKYVAKGIRIGADWYPIIVMDWVDGEPLDTAIGRRLDAPDQLLVLAENWLRLDRELTELGIAHGDLQHGNVLVSKGELRLVDYDGMFVPAFRGQTAPEAGHPNFQPPYRASVPFDENLDRYSSLVIYTALRALQSQPDLWQRYAMPDDGLLFRRNDFVAPQRSALMAELAASPDPVVAVLVKALWDAATQQVRLPNLDMIVSSYGRSLRPESNYEPGARWWAPRIQPGESHPSHYPWPPASEIESQPPGQPETSGWWKSAKEQPPQIVPGGMRTPIKRPTVRRTEHVGTPKTAIAPTPPIAPSVPLTKQPLPSLKNIQLTKQFTASRNRDKFHLPTCEWAERIHDTTRIWFDTIDDARQKGYKPCLNCKPTQQRLPNVAAQNPPPTKAKKPQRPTSPSVALGCTVEVKFDDDSVERFLIVEERTRPEEVSINSPIGKALLGYRSGDCVRYSVGPQERRCTIVNVKKPSLK